jgi:hypothetical protein
MKHKHTGIIQLCTNLVAFYIIRIRELHRFQNIYIETNIKHKSLTHTKKSPNKKYSKKQHKPHTKDV